MSTLAVLPPVFRMTGAQKEPPRLSRPIGFGATFLEHDFLVLAVTPGPPQFNGTGLTPPTSISASITNSGGAIAAGTYFVVLTYLNGNGETVASSPVAVTTTGTGTLTVESPPPFGDAIEYNVYLGTVLGTYHLANVAPLAIGSAYVKTTAYSAAGANPPATNGTALAAPSTPSLSATGTTGPAARTEYYVITYVTAVGETVASVEASQVATAGQLVTVASPAQSGNATGYNVYGALVSGQEVRQNTTPIAIGTNWTEPTTGLISPGVQRAVANQPGLLNGYPCILGVADHDYNATYGGGVGGSSQSGSITPFGRPRWNPLVFGPTEQYPMIATEPANAHIIAATVQFEIALKQAWDPGYAGLLGGLALDATSGYFIFDLTASNQIAQLVESVDGPGYGVAGDVNKRVAIKILPQYAVPS
jgi:hypothetical protein